MGTSANRRTGERNWGSYFNPSPDFRTQEGQVAAFDLAADVDPADGEMIRWLFRLCTGYGKTLLAYGVFWILRQRGVVDRMLVLTQADNQRTQFADDVADGNHLLGINLRAWVIEKKERDIRAVREHHAEVFVATYQQLSDRDSFISDMLDNGERWMVAADECHHLSVENLWARRQEALPGVRFRIGLSATPERHDAKRLLGLPEEPTVSIDYKQAYKEKVVKRVEGIIGNYSVHVNMDGQDAELTTDDLHGVTDMNTFETRRQLRYVGGYVDHMLYDAMQDYLVRESNHPGQNQMVFFCMSCRHAEWVCKQINELASEKHMPIDARWVGVGAGLSGIIKPTAENRKIIEDFQEGKFQALVQVAIAGEGFNNKRISVIAFMNLLNSSVSLLQQIGRGLRRNVKIPHEDDSLSVYASTDTPIAALIATMEAQAKEIDEEGDDNGKGGSEPGRPRLWDIPDLMVVDAKHQRTDYVFASGINPLTESEQALCIKYNISVEEFLQTVRGGATRLEHLQNATPDVYRSEQDVIAMLEAQVEDHVRKLSRNIFVLLKEQGLETDGERETKRVIGEIKRSIHGRWNRISQRKHENMLRADFEEKNAWLQEVDRDLKGTNVVPSWVRITS